MATRSKPLNSPPSGGAIFSRAALRRQRTSVERFLAWSILTLTWLGTIVAAHGGWEPILTLQWSLAAWVAGIVSQAALTWLQWAYADIWWVSWPARGVDATLTGLGYGPLFAGALSGGLLVRLSSLTQPETLSLVWWSVPTGEALAWAALGLAWGIIWLVSLGAAWYPEHTLVS